MKRTLSFNCAALAISLASALTVSYVHAAPGELDTAFGTVTGSPYTPAGVTRGAPSPLVSANTLATASVAVRSDGGYYLANSCLSTSGVESVCVTSYLGTGQSENPFSPIVPVLQVAGATVVGGVAVDSNDHAWVAASCNGQGCVAKRLRDGSIATNLGASGNLSRVNIPSMVFATSIDVGRDGKIAVGGRCFDGAQYHPCAIRLLPNGAIDSSFNGGQVSGWGNDPFNAIEQVVDGIVRKVVYHGDGRIYAGGRCVGAAIEWMCVAVLEADGSRRLRYVLNSQDQFDVFSFYTAPLWTLATSTSFVDMAIQSDGGMLLYGTCQQAAAPTQFGCAVRMLPDVGFDRHFGNNGYLRAFLRPDPMTAAGLVLRQDGSFVLLANCDVTVSSQSRRRLCVQTHTPSGNFSYQLLTGVAANDIEFDGSNSPLRLVWDGVGAARYRGNALLAVASCPDAGGFRWICVAKISLGALPSPHACSPDIDGDHLGLATTDAALVARIARGASATAAIANVIGAGAARSDWSQIRTHLNTNCATSIP
jgi:Domain of unknown function (DUF5122) beta-propeller